MITAKLGRLVSRAALALVVAVGIGAASISPAHAEWHNGQWGHWGWHNGFHVFIAAPYPYAYPYPYYGYYGYPYGYYYPPAYYAPAPVAVAPAFSFGFVVGGHHH